MTEALSGWLQFGSILVLDDPFESVLMVCIASDRRYMMVNWSDGGASNEDTSCIAGIF